MQALEHQGSQRVGRVESDGRDRPAGSIAQEPPVGAAKSARMGFPGPGVATGASCSSPGSAAGVEEACSSVSSVSACFSPPAPSPPSSTHLSLPSSPLFTASATASRASSLSSDPATATAHGITTFFLSTSSSTSSSATSLASAGTALTTWPEHDGRITTNCTTNNSNDNSSSNKAPKQPRRCRLFSHRRSQSAGTLSSAMRGAGTCSSTSSSMTKTATRAASDNFLRASFEASGASSARTSSSSGGHWRPASARSARSARSRTRSSGRDRPSPISIPPSTAQMIAGGSSTGVRASTGNSASPTSERRTSYNYARPGAPPPLTCEEFDALPMAIQRKYFSTLERLRFAQGSSGQVDGIYQHYDAISAQNFQRRRSRQNRVASDSFTTRLRKRSLRESPALATAADTLFYANLPEKIKKREFTREEQVLLAGQLRASVILDAADEAIYKIGRRDNRRITPDITVDTPTSPTFRHSMETIRSGPRHVRRDALGLDLASSKRISGVPESFYDSFRWLDEEDDLDLRLFLDDYHSNLRESLPSPSHQRRPSFRRHLSISKMPFSRPLPAVAVGTTAAAAVPSTASPRPATKDDASMTTSPSMGGMLPFPNLPSTAHSNAPVAVPHMRRKSRTLSLISPKHAAHDSISTIDPGAAHYQDPEARLKLRVYLASPQKFDEAIEFGFPSTEVLSSRGSPPVGSSTVAASTASAMSAKRRKGPRQSTSDGPDSLRTFLADDDDDDDVKLDSDQASIPDPESPKTPNLVEVASSHHGASKSSSAFRPYRISTDPSPGSGHRPSDSYAQVPASSREMTLRMTLTRLDLRAGEDQIYGWQQPQHQHQHSFHHQRQPSYVGRKSSSQSPPPRDEAAVTYIGAGSRPKESIENVFAGIDHWEEEKGVMKRFWNRVRRS